MPREWIVMPDGSVAFEFPTFAKTDANGDPVMAVKVGDTYVNPAETKKAVPEPAPKTPRKR